MADRLAALAARAAAGQIRGIAGVVGIGTVGGAPGARGEAQLARAALGRRTTRQGAAADPAWLEDGTVAELARVANPLDVANGLGDTAASIATFGIAGAEVQNTGAAHFAPPPARTIGRRRLQAFCSRVGRGGGGARGTVVGRLGNHVGPSHGRRQHDHDGSQTAQPLAVNTPSHQSTFHGAMVVHTTEPSPGSLADGFYPFRIESGSHVNLGEDSGLRGGSLLAHG